MYGYLGFTIIGMIGLFLSNFVLSITYSNSFEDIIFIYGTTIFLFLGNLLLGGLISYLIIRILKSQLLRGISKRPIGYYRGTHLRLKKVLRIFLLIISYFTIGFGVLCSLILLLGTALGPLGFWLGIFLAPMATFLSFIFLSTTLLFLKLKKKRKNPKIYYGIALCGLVITGIFWLPLSLSPIGIIDAEKNFQEAFGDWRGTIIAEDEQYFLKKTFSIPQYFLGIPPPNCIVKEHISYYNGTSGVDSGIKLYFDAYMPLNKGFKPNSNPLPGKNSTIIRIHGGAWILGDKGYGNMLQVNKYFASQGYIVFDIQYGLKDTGASLLATPEYLRGNFSMDDIIRHIGIFIKFLTNHSKEYGANLDVVFISGGSAGGQLTCATALAIHSGNYEHYFGSNLTIKGLIPFYPANGGSVHYDIGGDPKLIDPILLVNNTSPPCLIYQGIHDPLEATSRAFRLKYLSEGNTKCAILWQYLAGHAADIYFSGHYSQIFLFYMERFLYMCVNSYI